MSFCSPSLTRRGWRVALAAAAVLVSIPTAHDLGAQTRDRDRERDRERDQREMSRDDAFTWTGAIPSGRTIRIRNINGAIDVQRSSSGRVEVQAEKRWRRGNPEDVRIEQKRFGDDIVICAMWNEESVCREDRIETPRSTNRNRNNQNDVSVRFTVRVPEGVRVDIATVNGGLSVRGVTTTIDASTVNGSIEARSAGGPVRAKTVNGSIDVSMGSLGSANELEYETVNGSITVELPSNFGAQLELSTVNGRVSTDFPITVSGTLSPRRLRGTIGNGATRFQASTVNGSVNLRRQ